MSWRWWRKPAVLVTVRTHNEGTIIAPVDAIDWARWFNVEARRE